MRKCTVPFLLLAAAFLLLGCGGSSSSGRARPSLSDAMEEAQKDPEDQQPVRPTKTKDDDEADDSETVTHPAQPVTTTGAAAVPSEGGGSEGGLRFGLFGSYGGLSDDGWESYGAAGAFIGIQRQGASGSVRIAGFGAGFGPRLEPSAEGGGGMFAEAKGILNLMPEHTFADLGAAGVVRFGFLSWSYRNPITYQDGDETRELTSDMVGTFTLMAGPTAIPARSKHLSLGITLLGGGQFYTENTLEGFRNDVFSESWIFELSLDVAYRRTGDPVRW